MIKSPDVFIIEDTPSAQFIYREILSAIDMPYIIFGSGEEFLEYTSTKSPQSNAIIIMDIGLPGIDGVELLKTIQSKRSSWKKIPVIAVTAHVMTHEIDHYKKQGFLQVIQKPIQVKLFTDLMLAHLNQSLVGWDI